MKASKKIKLFIDGHSFDREYQGTHVFIAQLYSNLAKLHPEIELYAAARDTKNLQHCLPFIPERNLFTYTKKQPGVLRFVTDIPHYIRKHGFDFAHFQYVAPLSKHQCRYIVTLHDILFKDFSKEFPWTYIAKRNFMFKKCFTGASIRTTVSHYSRARISAHYKMDPEAISVIPSGVEDGLGVRFTKDEAVMDVAGRFGLKDYILYVSRIEPRKNQYGLLKKYLDLRLYQKNIPLVFVGKESIPDHSFTSVLNQLSPEIGSCIHWYPALPPGDLEKFYKAARLFVYPSKAEGFGVPPLEAAVCQVPVLCSSVTAMGDFDFFDPWRFDPEDDQDFENKFMNILAHPPNEEVLQKTSGIIRNRYNWERTAEKFFQLLNQHLA